MNIRVYFLVISIGFLLMPACSVVADTNISHTSSIVFTAPAQVVSPQADHDYVLEKVSLAGDYAYTRPGRSVTPRIIITNQGGDDIAPGNVPVEAWLGDTRLIPVTDTFPPLKGGTSAMFDLRFMIPHDIPRLPNHLTIKIDPWNTRKEAGDGINELSTLSLVVIEDKNKSWDDF
ncbi:hypothetical protein [Methanospirillum hungatei]|uniref:hypothetical protein n=1 Tax=Methanospirillum hungatei TaxID=2203 RepID=UPI0026EF32AD|nr:hypothetical protein [Methanospirillum hungatei]MCA1915634.1 hypothetical protein [Methanospirillum hungatei]